MCLSVGSAKICYKDGRRVLPHKANMFGGVVAGVGKEGRRSGIFLARECLEAFPSGGLCA